MERPLVYNWERKILSRLFPRETRGATIVARRLSKSMGAGSDAVLGAWRREPRKKHAMYGTV